MPQKSSSHLSWTPAALKDLANYFRPFKIKIEIQASEAKDFKLFERSEFLKSAKQCVVISF
ncbi:MAG TPA: hypothetical protein VF411_04345 [Bacteroidia bacterium]